MANADAPWHAHIYFTDQDRAVAAALRDDFAGRRDEILFVGRMMDHGVGPHPIPQYEIHFLERSLAGVVATIKASGLRALVHPLTDDDLADHTTLGQWLGEPLDLNLTVLDPPGINQGVARFGKGDF